MSLLPIIAEGLHWYTPLVNGETQDVYGAETLMRFYLPDGTWFPQ